MCRKNLASLTTQERQAFTNALVELKDSGGYDAFPEVHSGAMTHGHSGAAFLPWHREFIRGFEMALQAIDPTVWLPYWDFTVANLNADGTESLIWRDDFLGGAGDPTDGFAVNDGPFSNWGLRRNNFDEFSFPGNGGDVLQALSDPVYSSFRSRLEGRPHGRAHTFVGGDAADFRFSPRDPVFWLIHCNIDRLWAQWIDDWEGTANFSSYMPVSGATQGHNLNDTMWPWNGTSNPFALDPWVGNPISIRPVDRLNHLDQGVRYQEVDGCILKAPVLENKNLLDNISLIDDFNRFKGDFPKELKEGAPKELKEGAPKELKEQLPKELKENLPKEQGPKEFGPKEFGPKELGPKEFGPKEGAGKEIREDLFIDRDLRPDLTDAALSFEADLDVVATTNRLGRRARRALAAKRLRENGI